MSTLNRKTLIAIGALSLLAVGAPALGADVDINVQLPGVYQMPAPVYVQPQPTYVLPRPVIVQPPIVVERENRDDRYWDCKKDKCKYKKYKKEKHGKHHDHHHDDD